MAEQSNSRSPTQLLSLEQLAPLRAPARDGAGYRKRMAEIDAKIARINRQAEIADSEGQAARQAMEAENLSAVLEDRAPKPLEPALVAKIKKGRSVSETAASARQVLGGEKAALAEKALEAQASFTGAVFDLVTELQEAAREDLVSRWPELAPLLARLISIDEVRTRYCGANSMKLTSVTDDRRPWSGSALVAKMVEGLPERFSSPAIGLERLRALAKPMADSLISQIEGSPE